MREHGPRAAAAHAPPSCGHDWCATAHGTTTHPDDEDHRSHGILAPAIVRARESRWLETEVEIGLLRRRHDAECWLVIEDGADVHLEVTLDTARALVRTVLRDPALRAALHRPSSEPQPS
ncbi:hypothetical protein [Microbacterium sp.]|uniref:hypothetical protein n=1 Tax=Microbacterium sp. TaxID=51671 RepID=UPI0039E4337D